MKVHIYVLFLSIWAINCFNGNKTDESSTTTTTGMFDQTTRSTGIKLDDFRKRLLGFIVGIMIIAFTFTCFCLLHYNCMVEEAPSPGRLNKENMAAISSWVSQVSACQPDMITEDILENQPLLNSDQKSGPPCQEQLPIPNSAVKSVDPSSLEKPCIPSNTQKLRYSNTENSSILWNVKKSNRQLDSNRSTKPSMPQSLHKSSYLHKSYKKGNLKNSHKLTHACKLASRVSSSSLKDIIQPWLATVQYSAPLSMRSCSSLSQSQDVPIKPPSIKKPSHSRGRHDRKKSVSRGKSLLHKHTKAKLCRQYKEKCLTCNPSGSLSDFSVSKKAHVEILNLPRKMKPSYESYCETAYNYNETRRTYNVYHDKSTDATKTYDSEGSDEEVILIYDTSHDQDTTDKDILYY
ncbi:uncharacterized protein CXorf66 homolog [Acomys russatus]|uniref:uncharacterized protein CXorf66 homolog n=1 Tax=Acomys russatus TaxID=60746 RepID=UPI0021E2F6AD|nr:uncharacterized protein CXorf66 homolog [Acomys russatus]